MTNKIRAIYNILTNKPVMMNTTVYLFMDEEPRLFDRLHHLENKDGVIVGNTFKKHQRGQDE